MHETTVIQPIEDLVFPLHSLEENYRLGQGIAANRGLHEFTNRHSFADAAAA